MAGIGAAARRLCPAFGPECSVRERAGKGAGLAAPCRLRVDAAGVFVYRQRMDVALRPRPGPKNQEAAAMKLTTRSRYGTRMILDMALHGQNGPVRIKDIAARQGVSIKYLEKLVRELKQAGFVKSRRGPARPATNWPAPWRRSPSGTSCAPWRGRSPWSNAAARAGPAPVWPNA